MIVSPLGIKYYSTFKIVESRIPLLKKEHYQRLEKHIMGDAPKDFIRAYEFRRGKVKRANPRTWPRFIAKVGHKYYPNESITEHLITRIGQAMKLNIADSRLVRVGGQIRFCSRFFHFDHEILEHGAQILSGYLSDPKFVEDVGREKQERELFTFEVVECAVRHQYPKEADAILSAYVVMLAFDTIVGNNDRHFYNWGVLKTVAGSNVRFSPIYDTARGLFWNEPEVRLERNVNNTHYLEAYVSGSKPLTSWDGKTEPSHFELLQEIYKNRPIYRNLLQSLHDLKLPETARDLLNGEFEGLFSDVKKEAIVNCLRLRVLKYGRAMGMVTP